MNSNGRTSDARNANRSRGQKPRNEKTREKTTRHVTPTAEQQKKNPSTQGEAKENKIILKLILGSKIRKQEEPPRAEKKTEEEVISIKREGDPPRQHGP